MTSDPYEQRRARRSGLIIALVGGLIALLSFALPVADGLWNGSPDLSASGARAKIVLGSEKDDEIYGGSGPDILVGGRGDDFVEARDEKPDYVDCGPGQDTISIDQLDRVAGGCENVYKR